MPRPYPPEFRERAVALVRAGKPISRVAAELGISEGGLHNWVRQLEAEVEILKRAAKLLGEDRPMRPKGHDRWITQGLLIIAASFWRAFLTPKTEERYGGAELIRWTNSQGEVRQG